MSWDENDDTAGFLVVINHEDQYSIWPETQEIPAGWRPAGKNGPKRDCLAWIDEVWTDMRPRSLREAMDGSKEGASET